MPQDNPRRERFILTIRSKGKRVDLESRSHGKDRVRRAKYLGFLVLSVVIILLIVGVCSYPTISRFLQESDEYSKSVKDLDGFQLSELLERVFRRLRR